MSAPQTPQLIDAMLAHPILINRPIVVTPWGVKLCRPSEAVLEILPLPQKGAFSKEDGERVIDERGQNPVVRPHHRLKLQIQASGASPRAL